MRPHCEGALREACDTQRATLERAAEMQKPKIIPVPDDEELAAVDEPAAMLRIQLKHLKGRAAQCDATIDGILQSRFTTPDILRSLPAFRVLDRAVQADQVAAMIAAVCGDNLERWNALPSLCDPPPARKTTFGAWLDQLPAN